MLVPTQDTQTESDAMPQKMPVDTRPKFISFNLKTLSAAVISAVLFSNAYAAGLGKLTVLSSLGQPLHAEIELTSVSKDEAGSLTVRLASTDAFRQANIEFNPALFALRFAVEQRGGRQFIRVTSSQPINEPFVDMLLEVGAANSRLVREYTFLLDPADLRRSQPVQIATPNAPPSSASQPPQAIAKSESAPQPLTAEKPAAPNKQPRQVPAQRAAPARQPTFVSKFATKSEEYEVKKGDTLARIAGQVKPEGISLDQMLIALQRANPNAFVGNNINRLRAGQILSVPDSDTARGISNSEASGIVIAQAADFNSYQNKLAGRVASAAPQMSDEVKQSATGKITSKVEEQSTAANEAKDKLKLSKSGAAAASTDKGANTAAVAEDRIAKDKALAEANARVKDLEKNVSDLQKLLEIKNKDLAEKQGQANVAKSAAAPAAPVPSPVNPPASSAATPKAAAPVTTPAPVPVPAPTASTSQSQEAKPAATKDAKPAAAPVKQKPAVPVTPPETSLIDDLLGNPLLLSLAAIALVGLGALGIYSSRRKKQRKDFQDSNILTDSSLKANSLFGSTGGQSVDTNNSVFNSNFAPSASQLDTNEVDPVAEADVYIAYGRDAQAEEILKEALRTQPERNAVRVKLLEIYANRKDLRTFEILASELYGMTKGEGDDWQQAASLGLAIDPKNPLYAGGKAPEAAAKAAALTAPTEPLDELDLDALLNTTQTSNASLENLNTIESGPSYFDNTVRATEVKPPEPLPDPDKKDRGPVAALAPASAPETSNRLDFDFDLAGFDLKEVELPPAAQPAMPPELSATPDGLDFDFLQESSPAVVDAHHSDTIATAISPKAAVDDFAPLDIQLSNKPESSKAAHESAAAPSALDFDLSGINLDLNPADSTSAVMQDAHETGGDSHSNTAEMATKLDLALAYQEIGDKEGARELLDEVVKGGTVEQTEKAKSILQKIA
jgi:pilus assembly protein FimV